MSVLKVFTLLCIWSNCSHIRENCLVRLTVRNCDVECKYVRICFCATSVNVSQCFSSVDCGTPSLWPVRRQRQCHSRIGIFYNSAHREETLSYVHNHVAWFLLPLTLITSKFQSIPLPSQVSKQPTQYFATPKDAECQNRVSFNRTPHIRECVHWNRHHECT